MNDDLVRDGALVFAAYTGLGGLGFYFVQLLWKQFIQGRADNTVTTAASHAASAASAESATESEARQNVVVLQDQCIDRLQARLAKCELELERERARRHKAECEVFDLRMHLRGFEQTLPVKPPPCFKSRI